MKGLVRCWVIPWVGWIWSRSFGIGIGCHVDRSMCGSSCHRRPRVISRGQKRSSSLRTESRVDFSAHHHLLHTPVLYRTRDPFTEKHTERHRFVCRRVAVRVHTPKSAYGECAGNYAWFLRLTVHKSPDSVALFRRARGLCSLRSGF